MPFHNAAAHLEAALDSIRGQTIPDWELIAVDDGSTDASTAVLERYAARDDRIRLFRQPHAGIVASLQFAAEAATAPYLARMDADDRSRPTRLAQQLAAMEADPTLALCGCGVEMIGATLGEGRLRYRDWLNAVRTPDEVRREAFIECPVAHPAFLMRRTAFDAVGGYADRGWAEDYDLVLRLVTSGYRVANLPEALLDWRESEGRLSMRDERYSEAQFRACKRHYLPRVMPLDDGLPLVQWGAGEVGKRWLRDADAFPTVAVVDLHPRKIGRRMHGVLVIPPEDLPPVKACRVLVAVGAPGARDEIRAWLTPRGFREGTDFLFVA